MGSPFGLGFVGAIPPGANPTPVQLGTIRDATFDYSQDLVPLESNYAFARDMALGKRKASLKAKYVYWQSVGVAAFLTGSVKTTGLKYLAVNEPGTIPGTPYQVTVAQSATWDQDWGVQDLTAAKQLTRVASGPATGQYSVAAGIYTFAAADTTHNVQITYSYTSAATGATIAMANQLMAPATGFVVRAVSSGTGAKFAGVHFYNAFVAKLTLGLKPDNWADTDVEFEGIEDPATGKVFDLYAGD
jgi:hypothetical protein